MISASYFTDLTETKKWFEHIYISIYTLDTDIWVCIYRFHTSNIYWTLNPYNYRATMYKQYTSDMALM